MEHPFKVGQKVAYVNAEKAEAFHPKYHPEYRGIILKISNDVIYFGREGAIQLSYVLNDPEWEMKIIEESLPYKKGDMIKYQSHVLFDGTPLYYDYMVTNCFSFKDEVYVCYDYQQRRWIVNVKDVKPVTPRKMFLDEEENTEI